MIMPARSVDMTMFGLFFAGITNISNFHVKGQLHARKRVVAIDIHVKSADFQYRHLHRTLLGLQIQDLANRYFSNTLESFQWNSPVHC